MNASYMPGNIVQGQGKGCAIVPHRVQVREGLESLGELVLLFVLFLIQRALWCWGVSEFH